MGRENWTQAAERIYERFRIRFIPAGEGIAESELELRPEDGNFLNMPYGGILFNMADVTAGAALRSIDAMGLTISGDVRFMRGVPNVKMLRCRAELRKLGKSIAFVDAAVFDEQGQELAAMSFSFARKREPNGSL